MRPGVLRLRAYPGRQLCSGHHLYGMATRILRKATQRRVWDDGWRLPDALWAKMEPLLPARPTHPLGCHNPRVPDRAARDAIFFVLRTGYWGLWGRADLVARCGIVGDVGGGGPGAAAWVSAVQAHPPGVHLLLSGL